MRFVKVPIIDGRKVCGGCGVAKPLDEFGPHPRGSGGRQSACRDCKRVWKQNNKDRVAAHDRKQAQQPGFKDRANARRRISRGRNPAADRERSRLRTYRTMTTTPETTAWIADLLRMNCVYCGSGENIEADHLVALSRGGKHEIGNLVPACRSCNRSKRDLPVFVWLGGIH